MTLHRAVEVSRKLLIVVSAILGGLFLLLLIATVGSGIKNSLFPPPPVPPNVRFGKLSFSGFPGSIPNQISTYSLNTISGKLPVSPAKVSVYKLLQSQPNLLGLSNANILAQQNGFTNPPAALSDSVYVWTNTNPFARLTYNIVNQNFSLATNFITDSNVLAAQNLHDQQNAIDLTKSFFTAYSSYPLDLDDALTQTSLFSIQNQTLVPATSLSNAQIIRVDLFQKNINKIPIYYDNYPKSPMYALVGSGDKSAYIVKANFNHKTILTDFEATYPAKTIQQAFNELKTGKGYIANYNGSSASVNISNISLGYYIGNISQLYTIPIFVFSGDNNFYAYVIAIPDQWFDK